MSKVTITEQTHGEMVKECLRAIALKSDYAEAYLGLARAYAIRGQDKEEVEALNRSIALNPNLAEAHCYLGFSRLAEKFADFREVPTTQEDAALATGDFTRALQLKPDFADAYTGLGWAYWHLKRFDEAVEVLKQAIHFKPADVVAHLFLGKMHIELGDKKAAMEEYEALISLVGEWQIDLEATGFPPELNLAQGNAADLLKESFGKKHKVK